MAKAILYNDLWDFYDHDSAETRCFYLPIEEEDLQPYFVDYEPVVHAHWEDCSNGWMCSNCYRDRTYETDYCPNCGAKMDEVIE